MIIFLNLSTPFFSQLSICVFDCDQQSLKWLWFFNFDFFSSIPRATRGQRAIWRPEMRAMIDLKCLQLQVAAALLLQVGAHRWVLYRRALSIKLKIHGPGLNFMSFYASNFYCSENSIKLSGGIKRPLFWQQILSKFKHFCSQFCFFSLIW